MIFTLKIMDLMNFSDDQRSASVDTRSASIDTRSASIDTRSEVASVATRSASVTSLPVPASIVAAATSNEFESNVVATLQTLNNSIKGLASALVHHGVLPNQWQASPIAARIGVGSNQAPLDPTQSNPQTTSTWRARPIAAQIDVGSNQALSYPTQSNPQTTSTWQASPIAARIDVGSNQAPSDPTQSNPQTTSTDQMDQEEIAYGWWEDSDFSVDLNPAVLAAQAQIDPSFSFPIPIPDQYDEQTDAFYSNTDINQPYSGFLQGSSSGGSTREEEAQWENFQQNY
jgi:hypothetical protein